MKTRTETTTREYDEEGRVVKETVVIHESETPSLRLPDKTGANANYYWHGTPPSFKIYKSEN